MIDYNTLIMFMTASLLLALAPGPDNIFVLTQSIVNGRSAGMKIILGLCSGLVFHTTIVALGVSAIFQTSLIAFNILKYLGVAYLLYLSWKAFRASSGTITITERTALTSWQLYRRGVIMNITNPKVSIFFMAFLPQFTHSSNGPIIVQLIILGLLFILATIVVFSAISQLAGIIGSWILRSARGEKILNRIAGTVFASLALKLILTEQK
ncbi:MAG TPA: LysE family translocator [Spirochaetota bacterium]|nr:LysE family translocator [Spirochaetota bacterium]HPI87891.1 LysE family translocator [Spirochaetota bacterium]HPR47377.1 LysE family translocator [Spirochaetota bacterium]